MADAGYRGQAYGKAKEQEEALSAVPVSYTHLTLTKSDLV